jgi:hypothetical protein
MPADREPGAEEGGFRVGVIPGGVGLVRRQPGRDRRVFLVGNDRLGNAGERDKLLRSPGAAEIAASWLPYGPPGVGHRVAGIDVPEEEIPEG